MLDNGEALVWAGSNRYRQINGGAIYTAEPDVSTPIRERHASDAAKECAAMNRFLDHDLPSRRLTRLLFPQPVKSTLLQRF